MREPIATNHLPATAAERVNHATGATLFAGLPDGTPTSSELVRFSVPAHEPEAGRATRRVMGWTRLGWQPAAPRV
jgi:hypothetical protein